MERHQKVAVGAAVVIAALSLLPVVAADTTSMQIRAWTLSLPNTLIRPAQGDQSNSAASTAGDEP